MKKALVIDDDESVSRLIEKLLIEKETLVDIAYDGRAGIMKIKEKYYDIIFLDVIMPGLGGKQVLGILNRLEKSIPVIIVSGHLTKDSLIQLKEMGVIGFLSKPFNIEKFYNMVDQVYSADN